MGQWQGSAPVFRGPTLSSSVSSLMTKTEIDLETSAYLPLNLLTRLPAPEYFTEFTAHREICRRFNILFLSCSAVSPLQATESK